MRRALKGADLAVLGPAFLAPWFAPSKTPMWRFAGRFDAVAAFRGGSLLGLDVSLLDVGIAHADGGSSAGPSLARLRGGRERRAQRANRGGRRTLAQACIPELSEFRFVVGPTGFHRERVRLPLLGTARSKFEILKSAGLKVAAGSAGGVVEPLSLKALTEASISPMAGVVSASISTIRHRPGELSLDGALVISVFDGFLRATDLHILEPLGRVPRLQADVELRHIDLGLLTQTFEFGRVTGYLDGDVARLQLASWRPIGFEAGFRQPRLLSTQDQPTSPCRISVRSAAAAQRGRIQRSFLGFSESLVTGEWAHRASCAMASACWRVLKVIPRTVALPWWRGGVPALNVIGYNRRVDWNN